jgi:hypothetical protein
MSSPRSNALRRSPNSANLAGECLSTAGSYTHTPRFWVFAAYMAMSARLIKVGASVP